MKTYKLYAILSKTHLTLDKQPDYVVDKEKTAKELSPIIGMDEEDILNRLSKDTYQVEFGSYGNNLSSLVKDQIDALNFLGLEFEEKSQHEIIVMVILHPMKLDMHKQLQKKLKERQFRI